MRVLLVSSRLAKKRNPTFEDDGRVVMATVRETLLTQLHRIAKAASNAEVFPSCEQAADEKRMGLPISDFVDLFFGVPSDKPWSDTQAVLTCLGFRITDDAGVGHGTQKTIDIVLRVPTLRKGLADPDGRDCAEGALQTQQAKSLKAVNKRAYEVAMGHWQRDLETGTLFTLNPKKHCSKEMKAKEWNVGICEIAYRSTFKRLAEDMFTAAGPQACPDPPNEFRRKLQL